MKKITKKLALNQEVIRRLADPDLLIAQGGIPDPSAVNCDTVGPACTSGGHTCATRFSGCRSYCPVC